MIIRRCWTPICTEFTMMQVVLTTSPAAQVEYKFKCRTEGVDFRPYIDEIRDEVTALPQLRFRGDELDYLRSLRFMKRTSSISSGLFHFSEKYVRIGQGERPGRWTSPSAARGCTPSSTKSPSRDGVGKSIRRTSRGLT